MKFCILNLLNIRRKKGKIVLKKGQAPNHFGACLQKTKSNY